MNKKTKKILTIISALSLIGSPVIAESLFKTGISQGVYTFQPRSLYGTIKARTIGDVVTILIDENFISTSEVSLDIQNSAESEDGFTPVLNNLFKTDKFTSLDGYGGSTTTGNSAKVQRKTVSQDVITAQVVEVLPNGNLVVQGKKVEVNSKERAEILVSGIVDPRFISNSGQVSSKYIANLQFAVVGKGTVSSSESESLMNRFMNVLF